MSDTIKQARKRRNQVRKVIAALKSGRHLSLKNGEEFELSEMHTTFCNIRRKIAKGEIQGYVMKDRWVTDGNSVRYKEY